MRIGAIFFISVILGIIYILYKTREILYVNHTNYDILEIPNFLSDEECSRIIELSKNNLFPSRIYGTDNDILSDNMRKSNQCWLDDTDPVIKGISDKVRAFTKTPNNYYEQLQVVKYDKGGFFNPHYDACEGNKEYCKRMNEPNGPRLYTMIFYLNDDFEGGETYFPKINKAVKPQKGKAVLFKNVDDSGIIIYESHHGGNPVKSGVKWIANKWIRLN